MKDNGRLALGLFLGASITTLYFLFATSNDFSKIENKLTELSWDALAALSTIIIAALGFAINNKLQENAKRAQNFTILTEYRREIFAYACDFFDLTARAISQSEMDLKHRDLSDVRETAASLSALLDKGRFIFPNYDNGDRFGQEKGAAFAGRRREPLDAILAAYWATKSLCDSDSEEFKRGALREIARANQPTSRDFNPNSSTSLLYEARRSFINSVLPSTLPREWRKELSELLGEHEGLAESAVDGRVERHLLAATENSQK